MTNNNFIQHLFIKQQHKNPMLEVHHLYLQQNYGIKHDLNANCLSPRQILLVNREDLAQLSILPGQLRENIVLQLNNSQAFQPGAKIIFPSGAAIRLTFYCEPCKRIASLVDSLKTIEQKRGILATVIKSGAIAVNDCIEIKPHYFPSISEIPYERFLALLSKIPPGKVITYRQILTSIGVDRSYYRVMPLYLKKAAPNYPVHRVIDSKCQILSHIPQQSEKLAAEGIKLQGDRRSVCLSEYGWYYPIIY